MTYSNVSAIECFDPSAPPIARHYVDWAINGHLLGETIRDLLKLPLYGINILSSPASSLGHVERIRNSVENARNGRSTLYVCGECGDPECGVISAMLSFDGDDAVIASFQLDYRYGGGDLEVADEPILSKLLFRLSQDSLLEAVAGLYPKRS